MKIIFKKFKNVIIIPLTDELMDNVSTLEIGKIKDLLNKMLSVNIAKTDNFVIDLKELEFIQSSGIGFILVLNKMILEINRKLAFYNVNENIMEVFEITGLLEAFKIYETLEDAISSFKQF